MICKASFESEDTVECAEVRSNIRKFAAEQFSVWRCGTCGSIHAKDSVDLAHYYAHYPFHNMVLDFPLRILMRNILRRIRAGGVTREHSILDYGCGAGLLIQFLKDQGYDNVTGYDSFSDEFDDPAPLERQYDCLIAQDLIEHPEDPMTVLDAFDNLVVPGGVISIGTPNASGIDLADVERHVHFLHQPYHRHIFTKAAMVQSAEELGWKLVRYYPTAYGNTLIPGLNVRTWMRYASSRDNNLDLLFEPIRPGLQMFTPAGLCDVMFGGLNCPEVDVTYIFRKGE